MLPFQWNALRVGDRVSVHDDHAPGLDIHEGVPPATLLSRLACPAVATTADAPRSIYDADLRAPRLWLFGNEGQGLAPELLAAARLERLAIPQSEAVESLNVGVAAAVCLYEQLRQRRAG